MARPRDSFDTVVLPGSGRAVFCRGFDSGLPVFGFRGRPGAVPPELATRRQLRALGLRPGGADPVALLRFRHRRPYRRVEICELYRRDTAVPVRPMTPAKWAALDKANCARRARRLSQEQHEVTLPGPAAASRQELTTGPVHPNSVTW
ncbi:RRQRL motif-containing zinc-binding protein [Saccharothrix sp.]|uniref:RRQRL motif-containing zinc-binding protein n=1 Tax=Saccharothrix sp. TaxID=1873460 RepID=UPI0028110216|nr:RRQRL motif-containing zinc-binding protein [Saccharothrix sp.]